MNINFHMLSQVLPEGKSLDCNGRLVDKMWSSTKNALMVILYIFVYIYIAIFIIYNSLILEIIDKTCYFITFD